MPSCTPYWFVDGVSCVGKTTFVQDKKEYGMMLDYDVRSKTTPFFRQKAEDHIIQVLYSSTFSLELMQRLRQLDAAGTALPDRNDPDYDKRVLLCDRSPISDIWYELLFKSYQDAERYEQAFSWIEQRDIFATAPTIFVVPDIAHAPRIAKQMAIRQNGIDHICEDYIVQQIRVFEAVTNRFERHPNVRVIRIAADREMFTPSYFAWLHQQFRDCLRSEIEESH